MFSKRHIVHVDCTITTATARTAWKTGEDTTPGFGTSNGGWSLVSAEIKMAAAGGGNPTNDQLMRHGKWFNNGAEQPFTF